MSQHWTIREVAERAGRSADLASTMARRGMLPGYSAKRGNVGAGIPAAQAEAFAELLRTGAVSTRLAQTMRDDPLAVLRAAEALATLARAALATPALSADTERAA